jgi:NAD(P)-dependent dehydrogenase (short-subunit alcohol dehydrogenase family)
MQNYAEKTAVITGGTTGMGRAVADALIERGATVLITGRNEKTLAEGRKALGPRAHVLRSDAANLADIDALHDFARDKLGRLDAVFLNAGYSKATPFAAVTEAEYDRTFLVNTKGLYFTVQKLAPLVRDGGAFVFTTSIANTVGYPGMSTYAGAKAAVRAFAQNFAVELVDRQIRVNAVSPGFVKTETMGIDASEAERAAFIEEGERLTPLKRIGTPDEFARAALFLAFDATFTTGSEILLDGGMTQFQLPG